MSKFNMVEIISKKRDGKRLNKEEIDFFVDGYTKGEIPDYQVSALLMAIFFQKMDREETFELTRAMRFSGDVVDLTGINGIKVDKHSTGGVGDKTTFIVAPIAAACGVPIAKMSGRGLGFTGGTVDKMEAIPGLQTSIEEKKFMDLVNKNGISVIGQTAHISPADKKIYALRDVTATVDNLSLIASSIMSKKLASGSDAIVLDVKCGSGAFMKTEEEAEKLAKIMVEIGIDAGKNVVAVITGMDQPLGNAVGNSLEVIEAIETLKGKGPSDITELSLHLAGIMICLGGKANSFEEGRNMAYDAINNGSAIRKMRDFIEGQGGNSKVTEDYELFESAKTSKEVISDKEGFVCRIEADMVGLASLNLGAGRTTKDEKIDLSAGIYLHKKVGDYVKAGDSLATLYSTDQSKLSMAAQKLLNAYTFGSNLPELSNIIRKIIE